MGVGEWYIEKRAAQNEYDARIIDNETYERRTRFAIGMIYKSGDDNDKAAAIRMAKAHNYNIEELLRM